MRRLEDDALAIAPGKALAAALGVGEATGVSPLDGAVPGVVVVGAPRSGVLGTLAQLRQHPSLVAHLVGADTVSGEANHFHMKYDRESLAQYAQRFHPSAKALAGAPPAVGAEATTTYTLCPQVGARLLADLPTVRLVVVVRDEIDRAVSHYTACRQRGHAELGSFNATVARELAKLAACDANPSYTDPLKRWSSCYVSPSALCGANPWGSACASLFAASMYAHALNQLLASLPPAQLMLVGYDSLFTPRTTGAGGAVTPAGGAPALDRVLAAVAAHGRLPKSWGPESWGWKYDVRAAATTVPVATRNIPAAEVGDASAWLPQLVALFRPHRAALAALIAEKQLATAEAAAGAPPSAVYDAAMARGGARWV